MAAENISDEAWVEIRGERVGGRVGSDFHRKFGGGFEREMRRDDGGKHKR